MDTCILEKMATWTEDPGLPRHPLDFSPPPSEAELDAMRLAIIERGPRDVITVHEGKMLGGHAVYLAWRGIRRHRPALEYREFDRATEGPPLDFVLSNQHPYLSLDQRLAMGAKYLKQEEAALRHKQVAKRLAVDPDLLLLITAMNEEMVDSMLRGSATQEAFAESLGFVLGKSLGNEASDHAAKAFRRALQMMGKNLDYMFAMLKLHLPRMRKGARALLVEELRGFQKNLTENIKKLYGGTER